MKTKTTAHTAWCARDHSCNLIEHRAKDEIVRLPGHGEFIVTRVLGRDGNQYAEIRGLVRLHTADTGARWQLGTMLAGLRQLLNHLTLRAGVVRDGTAVTGRQQPAISRRAA
jgi:hypothetical protein